MNPPALPLGEERYTPTDGAEIVSGDQGRGSRRFLIKGDWRVMVWLPHTKVTGV